ncbi:MAG: ABC transporter transmembrane domain-containing protein [bacterium]|nr:ABC transporter transmembrane domain-containing protein [bacterium]
MEVVLQDGVKDCGVCCLLSVTRYYGGEISKELLMEMTNTNKLGVSAYNLIAAAEKIGFIATGVMGDLSKIEKNNLPCLAHVVINKSYKHFVVIYEINNATNKVVIMDPAKGKRILSFGEFKLMSSSNYIFLKPIKKLPLMSQKRVIKKTIKEFIGKERKVIILISILSIVLFILQIITSFHFKYLLEYAITFHLTKPIFLLSCYLLFIYLFKELAELYRNILIMKCSSLIDSLITFKTYKHILLLPYLYYKNRTTGEVISRLKDLNLIKSFLIEICCFFITDFISIVIFSLLLINLNLKLSLFLFGFSLLLFFIELIFNRFNKKEIKKVKSNSDHINSYLVESLSNIETVKNSHLEKRFFDTFSLKYKKLLENNYSVMLNEEIFSKLKAFINDLVLLVVFGYGSYLVIKNKMGLGDLIVYQCIFNYFMCSFNNLLRIFASFTSFKLAYNRIEDMFLIDREKFEGSYYYLLWHPNGTIAFKNLNYSVYDKKLFSNLCLNISLGEKVLLTGKSGSGKSTLMKILMRYIEVPYGYVTIKNIDINHYHLDVLRKNIVYVSNLEALFTDTIYNNIVLGREVSKEQFLEIANISGVNDFITSDLGYDQLLEENGSNFSNGERQRIILARALIKNSDIYIFDEAFSQIDSSKTFSIMKKVFNYLRGKTVIVISHRFSEQKLFDRILKLEDGQVREVSKL